MEIEDLADQIALVATLDTYKANYGYESYSIEEFLAVLDVHLEHTDDDHDVLEGEEEEDKAPIWDSVTVTDLTGDYGLHYDVMIDVHGEEYIHL